MSLFRRTALVAALTGAAMTALVSMPAQAQDISDTHLRAARSVVTAMRATQDFDVVLPRAVQRLRSELIQLNPDLEQEISTTVNDTALSLAARRADLEREAATAFARVYSESELQEIAAFYTSETGQKLLDDSSIVAREVYQAAEIWARGVERDLRHQVAEKLAADHEPTLPEGIEVEGASDTQ